MSLLLIPLIPLAAFALLFGMSWLEPKQTPAHRGTSRRKSSR